MSVILKHIANVFEWWNKKKEAYSETDYDYDCSWKNPKERNRWT